jgi:dienelactone hydrolase
MQYDPFNRGGFPVGVRTIQARDAARDRVFSCEIWYPAADRHAGQDAASETQDVYTIPVRNESRRQMAVRDAAAHAGTYPLIVYSHHSGGSRRAATYLCTHLSSHGYVVAAVDHSETFAPELLRKDGETAEQRTARIKASVGNRVPDVRFVLDHLLQGPTWDSDIKLDPAQVGLAGHSFGGWTVLATPEVDRRIRAVVTLAPGGNSKPRPGIIQATLTFDWGRDVPTLYLVAENDTPLPLDGMYELFERTLSSKQMVILRRADHAHFMDNAEQEHETGRTAPASGEWVYMQKEMLPITELCSEKQAHLFVRGLAVAHMDATLKESQEAKRFLAGDIANELARRGVEVVVPTLR